MKNELVPVQYDLTLCERLPPILHGMYPGKTFIRALFNLPGQLDPSAVQEFACDILKQSLSTHFLIPVGNALHPPVYGHHLSRKYLDANTTVLASVTDEPFETTAFGAAI